MPCSKHILIIALLMLTGLLQAQVYDNYPNALANNDSRIMAWATHCDVVRGYINISDQNQTYTNGDITSNLAFAGTAQDACGAANGLSTVSLGDGGIATVQFQNPIRDGEGFDFVVFENGFFNPPGETSLAFIELAFVEVSSDGIHFFRFNTVSEMPYLLQNNSFAAIDWTLFYGFAGVYTQPYGVAFDLADLPDEALINKQRITHVRVIDVVGCIQPEFASYDSQGNIVNDPWPTPFHTGGFDIDAVGVINEAQNAIENDQSVDFEIYPNPSSGMVYFRSEMPLRQIQIIDIYGKTVFVAEETTCINTENLNPGCYWLKVQLQSGTCLTRKLIQY
ncbi:MAG: T9SS type A sorting domain-containing protein [Bacteroidales bacterium]|nr:T9SS type A sorting domain-containing protein [Bacteroidales bacterium]